MGTYKIKVNPKAIRDLDNIFRYIALNKESPENAIGQVLRLETAIMSLADFPYAHQERQEGRFANNGYRQLLVDNYIAIYKVQEYKKGSYRNRTISRTKSIVTLKST